MGGYLCAVCPLRLAALADRAGAASGKRRLAPLARQYRGRRLALAALAAALAATLLWAVGQDYLFIASVFPIAAGWLGWGCFRSGSGLAGPGAVSGDGPCAAGTASEPWRAEKALTNVRLYFLIQTPFSL